MGRGERVTAQDVAREAGVSKTTVSFVVNQTVGHAISEDTRHRVMEVVERLGYVPNPTAQALRRGQNGTVLFVLPDLPLASVIARSVDATAMGLAQRGLSLIVRRLLPGQSLGALWRGLSPAALITIGGMADAEEAEVRAAGILVASFLLEEPAQPRQAVVISQELVARMQVEHLAERGCRRIAFAAPLDPRLVGIAEMRASAARRACADLGLPDLDVRPLELDTTSAMPVVDEWSRGGGPRTGVVAYNDEFGGAVLATLELLGRRAPDDLAVIGCDNDPMTAFTSPPLTTIDQLPEVAGARLAAITADELGAPGSSPVVDGAALALVVRSST